MQFSDGQRMNQQYYSGDVQAIRAHDQTQNDANHSYVNDQQQRMKLLDKNFEGQEQKRRHQFNILLEDREKSDALIKRNQYKDFLDNQVRWKRDELVNFGTMTGHEKKLNKGDLHNYKKIEPHIQAMIPGIHNLQTVGSSPLKRGLKREEYDLKQKQLIEQEAAITKQQQSLPALPTISINNTAMDSKNAYEMNRAGHRFAEEDGSRRGGHVPKLYGLQGSRSISHDIDNDITLNDRLLASQSPSIQGGLSEQRLQYIAPQSLIKKGPQKPAIINLSNNTIDDIARKKETGQDHTLGHVITKQVKVHNPITNPLAYVNQNPYVQKQMEQAKRSSVLEYQNQSPPSQKGSPRTLAQMTSND